MEDRKQYFGEEIAPVLDELENAILEFHDRYPNECPHYSNASFRAALSIFMDVVNERMFEYLNRLGWDPKQRLDFVQKAGNEIRYYILKYCDVATEKLY